MVKKNIFILLIFLTQNSIHAQEFQARVTVNAIKINNTVDKKIFTTFQTQLTNFLNSKKWTNEKFNQSERIECNFLINLESIVETNVYKGSIIIQAARPVYNTSYKAALINYQDADFTFKYIEYQPIEFNENRVQGTDALSSNISAIFAYYANFILGLDYDSFSPKGGDLYFQKAQNIVNNAPEGSNISGWKAFDGLRNRYWLVENINNSRYNLIHDILYSYYRTSLDNMYDKEKEARLNMLKTLQQLSSFNRENPNTMFIQFFTQAKSRELISIFKKGSSEERSKAEEILSSLDITNSALYKQELQ